VRRRSPGYTVGRNLVAIITALLFGATWWNEGTLPRNGAAIADVQNILGVVYAGLSFMGARLPRTAHVLDGHRCGVDPGSSARRKHWQGACKVRDGVVQA
jgi:hypothetical protein